MGGKSRAAGQANGFAFLKTTNWIQIALEPSAVRRRSSRSGPRPAKWDRFPFRLAKAGRNRAKPVPDLIRDPACCALQSVSNVKLTRHRIPLEFAEKGGYSSYTLAICVHTHWIEYSKSSDDQKRRSGRLSPNLLPRNLLAN